MVHSDALRIILRCVIDGRLGVAISQLENYLYTFAQPQASAQLEEIKTDYELMADYWKKGYDDSQREQLYNQLLRRVYVLTMNQDIRYGIRNSNYISGIYNHVRSNRDSWSPSVLRRDMESFVSEVALLELEPEHTRQQHQREVYDRHQAMMLDLFDYIWTARLWTDSVTDAFGEMLVSPTIDRRDQQLMVSAVTLSLLNFFDINKFRLLMSVYRKSADENVRQRALIGWVLCLNTDAARLYHEMYDMVKQAVEDERCLNELAELQMQIIYCLRAESDTQKIEKELMPELLKNNNIRVTRNGIEEVAEDPMEDILQPELSEQRMEKIEETMLKMSDMQRQGADIYFGGFSQMKHFPFFARVGNWFVPFYLEHPAVSSILSRVRGRSFLSHLMTDGPFCDSDKYSFTIAYEQTVNLLPKYLLQLMDSREAMLLCGDSLGEEKNTPAYIRRFYLQNLYRFYRVFPSRSEFNNPLGTVGTSPFYFFANPLFQGTRLEKKFNQVVSFIMKHGIYEAASATLQNYREEIRDSQFYLLNGTLLMRTRQAENAGLSARESFARCLETDPDNERAWNGYARSLFSDGDYEQALIYYRKLIVSYQDNVGYQLNEAVCLTNLKKYEEALKILYRLNYDDPDNQNVNRVLAWALVGACKYEPALKIYGELISQETLQTDDLLNAAYCHWFSGAVAQAIELFRRYDGLSEGNFNAVKEFLGNEASMIREHGIDDIEVRLMIDAIG